jgi:hypothetical protein
LWLPQFQRFGVVRQVHGLLVRTGAFPATSGEFFVHFRVLHETIVSNIERGWA